MKYDEFSFFNQQLAAMLRDGIPLEGALQRLCEDMQRGRLRDELKALESDLTRGTPIGEALKPRELPELYKRMVLVGVKGGDLPSALTMLADYFESQNNLWTRLKGLMVYPLIILVSAFLLSCFLSYILGTFIWNNLMSLVGHSSMPAVSTALWMSPVIIGVALTVLLIALLASSLREKLRWRLPAFREASLARLAAAIALMLKQGVTLDIALAFVQELETGTCAAEELAHWRQQLAAGKGKFSDLASPGRAFPPIFIWTVAQSGEDLALGFQRAGELYQGRASYHAELLLYSALPCSILLLAAMIVAQIQPVLATLIRFFQALGND